MAAPFVSVVIPVLRDTPMLETQLERLGCRAVPAWVEHDGGRDYEVIVVNGDSKDSSIGDARRAFPQVRWVQSGSGRGQQMNAGARLASGRWLLFLHADVELSGDWLEQIKEADRNQQIAGGCFTFALDSLTVAARLIEWGVRWRGSLAGLVYGDQGLFVRRKVFDALEGYRPIAIMEDLEFIGRIRRRGRFWCSPSPISVSARRWEHDGWLRRSALNMLLVLLYYGGVSPVRLARAYYGLLRPPQDADETLQLQGCAKPGSIAIIMPALNEEDAITEVLAEIPDVVTSVTVVDNGSTDATAARARAAGATVLVEPRRGYGRACLTGIGSVLDADIIVFLDADRSDYPKEVTDLVAPILESRADIVLGCRGGVARPMTARVGTRLCVRLINLIWGTRYRDLGPFRAIRRESLDHLGMTDQAWGWTIEMQVKAAETGLLILEVPIRQRNRIGQSKISGTVRGKLSAGVWMLFTICSLWLTRGRRRRALAKVGAR